MVRVLAKMKIGIIMGTRPEIIRLYHTVEKLPNKTIYWTGQNFEKNLSEDIFNDPWLKNAYKETIKLSTNNVSDFFDQFSCMLLTLSKELRKCAPDKVLILGDTNSSLAGALVAKKLNIPLYHMEAGNRCYDPNSPEEVNRKLIDSIADVHMCYTTHAKQNLLKEGIPQNLIHVIGNPIAEFKELHINSKPKTYILVTCHRKENYRHLISILKALKELSQEHKVVACIHPRYENIFKQEKDITCIPSVSFSQFVELQKGAQVIVTDSGTVCEEAAILRIPCVIIRRTMERPELFDHGTCILSGVEKSKDIVRAVNNQLNCEASWDLPYEYTYQEVSSRVRNILLGKGNFV